VSDILYDNSEKANIEVIEACRSDEICQVRCRDVSCEIPERRGFRPVGERRLTDGGPVDNPYIELYK